MCTIISKSKRKSFTGYKIAVKIRKKYYSPWTGVEYLVGKVNKIHINENDIYFTKQLDNKVEISTQINYNEKMIGKTGVIEEKSDAVYEYNYLKYFKCYDNKLILLKMQISEELYNAEFKKCKIIIGSHIDSFKEIKL